MHGETQLSASVERSSGGYLPEENSKGLKGFLAENNIDVWNGLVTHHTSILIDNAWNILQNKATETHPTNVKQLKDAST